LATEIVVNVRAATPEVLCANDPTITKLWDRSALSFSQEQPGRRV